MTVTSYRVRVTILMIIAFIICGTMIFAARSHAANAVDDPSIIARKYRSPQPPLQHYYPTTGVKPKIGRDEDLLAPSSPPEPEKTYRRQY